MQSSVEIPGYFRSQHCDHLSYCFRFLAPIALENQLIKVGYLKHCLHFFLFEYFSLSLGLLDSFDTWNYQITSKLFISVYFFSFMFQILSSHIWLTKLWRSGRFGSGQSLNLCQTHSDKNSFASLACNNDYFLNSYFKYVYFA